MSERDFQVGTSSSGSDEPAVVHPELQALVKAARMQPTPEVRVRAEMVLEGWQHRRATQRRGLVTGLAAAAALVITVGTLGPRLWQSDGAQGSVAPLDDATVTVHVEALAGNTTEPEILGPRHLRLPEGQWSIDSETAEPVVVDLPDGPLEVRGGALQVVVAGNESHVTVLRTEVDRIQTSGGRVALPVESTATEPSRASGPTATELAREAEEQMAAGDRQGAIRSLRRLVTRHGRSAAAQAGLIDLGRLLKASNQKDEARCAYAEFLERWPGHALTGDVIRAKRALGDGPACEGLRPMRQP